MSQDLILKDLTKEDVAQIKFEKRIAYVFIGLLFFGVSFSVLIYYLVSENPNLGILLFISMALPFLSLAIYWRLNNKYDRDIESEMKIQKVGVIQLKQSSWDAEHGTGLLWGQPTKEFKKHAFVIDNVRYKVSAELYAQAKEGDTVNMYYGQYSNFLLGIDIANS